MAAGPFNIFDDVANKVSVNSIVDGNPARPPDVSAPGTYDFNIYFLDFGSPYTYHRYPSASITMNLRMDGPPDNATFTIGFSPDVTPALDLNSSAAQIEQQFNLLPSVGVGQCHVSGDKVNGWTFEFVSFRGGKPQPLINANIVTSDSQSVVTVQRTQLAIGGQNEKQLVKVVRSPVATLNAFSETGVPSTPGWTTVGNSPLNTTNVPIGFWINPEFDVILEVLLFLSLTRSGTAGVTTAIAGESGTNGVITDDGTTASGTHGTSQGSQDRSGIANAYGGPDPSQPNVLTDFQNTGTFKASEVGRIVTTQGTGPAGLFILGVGGNPVYIQIVSLGNWPTGTKYPGAARYALSAFYVSNNTFATNNVYQAGTLFGNAATTVNYTVKGPVNNHFVDATANAFTPQMVGHTITGTNIAPNTTIVQWISASEVVLSTVLINQTTNGTWSVAPQIVNKLTDTTFNNWQSSDTGRAISGTNIATGSTIQQVIDSANIVLSLPPLASGTGLSWSTPAGITNQLSDTGGAFVLGDQGQLITSAQFQTGTTVLLVIDSTHILLSKTPLVATTGINWTIQYTGSGSAGIPVVTRIQSGTSSQPEIQTIQFSRQLRFGTFTLQDGAGGSSPLATCSAPLSSPNIQQALNAAYPGYGSVQVAQLTPTKVQITWGQVNGSFAPQNVLLVNDSNVTYDPQSARIVLVPAAQQIIGNPSGPSAIFSTIQFIGDVTSPVAEGVPIYKSLQDGSKSFTIRQRFWQLSTFFSPLPLSSPGPSGTVLIAEENMQDKNGIVHWDRVYAKIPNNRTEIHQQQRACIGVARTFTNGLLSDIQLYSVSISTYVYVYITYALGNQSLTVPPDGPAGTVLHFEGAGLGFTSLLTFNGFSNIQGTFNNFFTQSWSRKIWMGDIWEQRQFVN